VAVAVLRLQREMVMMRALWKEVLELWKEELELQREQLKVVWEWLGFLRDMSSCLDYMAGMLCRIEKGQIMLRTLREEGWSGKS